MIREGWRAAGICLVLGLAACGGSDDDDQGGDADAGTQNFSDQVKELRDQIGNLNTQLNGLDMRTDVLETPKVPGSCSTGELCIPDGISLVSSGLQPVIDALCDKEANCCTTGELSYLYGPSVKNADECKATFKDLINNAQVSDLGGRVGQYLETIVRAAHALNDTDILVKIDDTAVTACATFIGAEVCPRDLQQAESCTALPQPADPCSLSKLLKGQERDGDTCEPNLYFDECGDGLICRGDPYDQNGQSGTCGAKAAVGDRCTQQSDCDELYCDFTAGTCKTRAKEGEPCALLDPTFKNIAPPIDRSTYLRDWGSSTSIDCEVGFTCNAVSKTCTKSDCAQGAYCYSNSMCPAGEVCSNKASPELQDFSESNDTFVGLCVPGDLGAACDDSSDCSSGHCATDKKCSAYCEYGCVGPDCDKCPQGSFCEVTDDGYYCEPLIASGNDCSDYVRDNSCQSGFCDGNSKCAPKVAAGALCPTGSNHECPAGQWCSAGTCTAGAVALNNPCTTPNGFSNCDIGLYCWPSDGASAGKCFQLNETQSQLVDLPDGTYCAGVHAWCKSNWCQKTATSYACAAPLADGATCDQTNPNGFRCAEGSYCADGPTPQTGTCTKYLHTGETCDPAKGGDDCASGDCVFMHEGWVCDVDYSVPFCAPNGYYDNPT
ncbi:MAG: hypothetical protein QM778_22755 [Myxococcales bacterium]